MRRERPDRAEAAGYLGNQGLGNREFGFIHRNIVDTSSIDK